MTLARAGLLVALTLGLATPARAGFVLTAQNGTVSPGGTVTLDVWVTAQPTTPGGPPPLLDLYAAEFVLTPVGGTAPGGVRFLAPRPPEWDSPSYAFRHTDGSLNSSAAAGYDPAVPATNPAATYTTAWADDTYSISDGTADSLGADVSGAGRLLARLTVRADPGAAAGAVYRVVLGEGSAFWTPGPDSTIIPATLGGGELTVVPAASAVPAPAPAGFVVALVGGLPLLAARYRRSKHASVPAAASRS